MKQSSSFEVEQILDHKRRNGEDYFKIKWKGYSAKSATWEPSHHLSQGCDRLIRDFKKRELRNRMKARRGENRNPVRDSGTSREPRQKSESSQDEEIADDVPRKRDGTKIRAASRGGRSKEDEEERMRKEGMRAFVQELGDPARSEDEQRNADSSGSRCQVSSDEEAGHGAMRGIQKGDHHRRKKGHHKGISHKREDNHRRENSNRTKNSQRTENSQRAKNNRPTEHQHRANERHQRSRRKRPSKQQVSARRSQTQQSSQLSAKPQKRSKKDLTPNPPNSKKLKHHMEEKIQIQKQITDFLINIPGYKNLSDDDRKKLIYSKYKEILQQRNTPKAKTPRTTPPNSQNQALFSRKRRSQSKSATSSQNQKPKLNKRTKKLKIKLPKKVKIEAQKRSSNDQPRKDSDDDIMIVSSSAGIQNFNSKMRSREYKKKVEKQRKSRAQKKFNQRVGKSKSPQSSASGSLKRRKKLLSKRSKRSQEGVVALKNNKVDPFEGIQNPSKERIYLRMKTGQLVEQTSKRDMLLEQQRESGKDKKKSSQIQEKQAQDFEKEEEKLEIPQSSKKRNLSESEEVQGQVMQKPIMKSIRVQQNGQMIIMDGSQESQGGGIKHKRSRFSEDRDLREAGSQQEPTFIEHNARAKKLRIPNQYPQHIPNKSQDSGIAYPQNPSHAKNQNLAAQKPAPITTSEYPKPVLSLPALRASPQVTMALTRPKDNAILENEIKKSLEANMNADIQMVKHIKNNLKRILGKGTDPKFKETLLDLFDKFERKAQSNSNNFNPTAQKPSEKDVGVISIEEEPQQIQIKQETIDSIREADQVVEPIPIRGEPAANDQNSQQNEASPDLNPFKDTELGQSDQQKSTQCFNSERNSQCTPHFPNFEQTNPQAAFQNRLSQIHQKNIESNENSDIESYLAQFNDKQIYMAGKTRRQFEKDKMEEKQKLRQTLDDNAIEAARMVEEEKRRQLEEQSITEQKEEFRRKIQRLEDEHRQAEGTQLESQDNSQKIRTMEDHDFFVDYNRVNLATKKMKLMYLASNPDHPNSENLEPMPHPEIIVDSPSQEILVESQDKENVIDTPVDTNQELSETPKPKSKQDIANQDAQKAAETHKIIEARAQPITTTTSNLLPQPNDPELKMILPANEISVNENKKQYGQIEEVTLEHILKFGHAYMQSSQYSSNSKSKSKQRLDNSIWKESNSKMIDQKLKPNFDQLISVQTPQNARSFKQTQSAENRRQLNSVVTKKSLTDEKNTAIAKIINFGDQLKKNLSARNIFSVQRESKAGQNAEKPEFEIRKAISKNSSLVDQNSKNSQKISFKSGNDIIWDLQNSLTKFRKSQGASLNLSPQQDMSSQRDMSEIEKKKTNAVTNPQKGLVHWTTRLNSIKTDAMKTESNSGNKDQILPSPNQNNTNQTNQNDVTPMQTIENGNKKNSSEIIESQNFKTPQQPTSKSTQIQRKRIITTTQSNSKLLIEPKIEISNVGDSLLGKRNSNKFIRRDGNLVPETSVTAFKPQKSDRKLETEKAVNPSDSLPQLPSPLTKTKNTSKIKNETQAPKLNLKKVKTRDVGTDSFDLDSHRYKHYIIRNTDNIQILKNITIKGQVFMKICHESKDGSPNAKISYLYVEPFVLKKVRPDLLCDYYEKQIGVTEILRKAK